MNNSEGNILFGIKLDNEQLQQDARKTTATFKDISTKAADEGQRMDKVFKNIGKTLAATFTFAGAAMLSKQLINVRANLESLEVSFTTLAGKKAGKELFDQIHSFATTTPLLLQDLAKGAQMLLSFNTKVSDVMPILKAIGDISMGDAQKMNSLTLAFAQMSSTGHLMGQDLLQMINAGFNPLSVISEKTGKSVGELKEEMAKGTISASMIKDAFLSASSAGGKFNGMLLTQSKTINGLRSNLKGVIDDIANEVGEKNEGVITGALKGSIALAQNYKLVGSILLELIGVVGTYKAALILTSVVEAAHARGTTALAYAKLKLAAATKKAAVAMKMNPYAAAAAAIVALAFTIVELNKRIKQGSAIQQEYTKQTSLYKQSIEAERIEMDALFGRLKAAKKGTDEYKRAKDAIFSKYGDYLKSLGDEKTALNDIGKAYDLISKKAKEAAKERAMAAFTEKAADELAKQQQAVKEKVLKYLEKTLKNKTGEDGVSLAQTYYYKLKPVIEGGDVDAETQKIIDKFTTYGSGQQGKSVVDNKMQGYINRAKSAMNDYNRQTEKAIKLWGENPTQGDNEKSSFDFLNAGLKELQEELPKAVDQLNELKSAADPDVKSIAKQNALISGIKSSILAREKDLKIRKDINDQIKVLNASKEQVVPGSAEDKNLDARINELKAKLKNSTTDNSQTLAEIEKQYYEDVKNNIIEGEKEIEQVRISSMSNSQRLFFENQQRRAKMVEELRNKEEKEYNIKNPNAEKQGKQFDRSSITAADLSDEQKQQLQAFDEIAKQQKLQDNKKLLDELLTEYATYEQKRLLITQNYEKQKDALYVDGSERTTLKNGVTQGNVENINEKETEALNSLDEEIAAKQETYKNWLSIVGTMTLEQLDDILKKAQDELNKLNEEGKGGSKQAAVARAKIADIKELKTSTTPDSKAVKKWEDLNESLRDTKQTFDNIGESVGGTAGKIISTASTILASSTSVISGIVTLTKAAAASETAAAVGAAESLSMVEKASVILAIISAALQVTTALFSVFKKNDYMAEFNREAEKMNQELKDIKLNARIGSDDSDSIFGDNPWQNAIENIKATKEAFEEYNTTIWKIKNSQDNLEIDKINEELSQLGIPIDPLQNNIDAFRTGLKSISQIIAEMQIQIHHSTWFKKATYGDLKTYASELFDENGELSQEALKKFIGSDIYKKLSKENQDYLTELSDQWETYQKGVEATHDYLTDLFGDFGNTLMDVLVDAFEGGTDAGKEFIKSMSTMLEELGKQMIYSVTFGKIFSDAQAAALKVMNSTGTEKDKFTSYTKIMADMIAAAKAKQGLSDDLMQQLKDLAAAQGFDIFSPDDTREAASEGIATASQESVDLNNSRLTTIQGHTYNLSNKADILTENSGLILKSLIGIQENTDYCKKLAGIEQDIGDVKSSLDMINSQGISIKI